MVISSQSAPVSPAEETARPICAPEALAVVRDCFDQLVQRPLDAKARTAFQRAVESLSPDDAQFPVALEEARRRQLEQHGGFTQRYVLSKDVTPEGSVRPLPRRIPVRDDMCRKLSRLAKHNPAGFPGGLQPLLDSERPLQQARSSDYANLIAATVRCELDSLLKCNRAKLLKSCATLLELAQTFCHLQRLAAAHPKVVEIIDRHDTAAMIDFLVTVAARTPLSELEFERFIRIACEGWKQATDRDVIVRGRVLHTGLEGKSALLKTWVEPFAAEVAFRGLLPQLQAAYRRRLQAEAAALARTASRGGAAVLSATEPQPAPATTPESRETTTFAANRTSDGFQIPVAVPEPERLYVLRNYLRCASAATVIRLSEAMRISEAKPDVPDHRLHVQRVFQEEGWAIVGQSHGDPMFSRLSAAAAGEHSSP